MRSRRAVALLLALLCCRGAICACTTSGWGGSEASPVLQNATTKVSITSGPNAATTRYASSQECWLLLEAPQGQVVQLGTWESFETEFVYDFLVAYDGNQATRLSMLWEHSGDTRPLPTTSSGRYLLLHFSSDSSVVGPGFKTSWTDVACPLSVCGNGVVECGEACDDGNALGGDGCSSECSIETTWQCWHGFSSPFNRSCCAPLVPLGRFDTLRVVGDPTTVLPTSDCVCGSSTSTSRTACTPTIQAASVFADHVSSGQEIVITIQPGTYAERAGLVLPMLVSASNVTFTSAVPGQQVTISGAQRTQTCWAVGPEVKAVTIQDITFSECLGLGDPAYLDSFGDQGGGLTVHEDGAEVTLRHVHFVDCAAKTTGGGLFIRSESTVRIQGGSFTGNHAVRGGAIFAMAEVTLTMEGTVILNNVASKAGGALSVGTESSSSLQSCQLLNNTAGDIGGTIEAIDASVMLINSQMRGGAADAAGSCIFSSGDLASLEIELTDEEFSCGSIYYSKGASSAVQLQTISGRPYGSACVPGLYQPARFVGCVPSEPGFFSLGENHLPCPAGLFSPLARSTSCQTCSPGSFAGLSGSSTCTECNFGSFSDTSGSEACRPCDLGRAASKMGAVTCETCTAGQVASNTSSVGCLPCHAGKVSNDAHDACLNCEPGTTSVTGSQLCVGCEPGKSQSEIAGGECAACLPATYAGASYPVCEACPRLHVGRELPRPAVDASVSSETLCIDGRLIFARVPAGFWWNASRKVANISDVHVCIFEQDCINIPSNGSEMFPYSLTCNQHNDPNSLLCSVCDAKKNAFRIAGVCVVCEPLVDGMLALSIMLSVLGLGLFFLFAQKLRALKVSSNLGITLSVFFDFIQLAACLSRFPIRWPDPVKGIIHASKFGELDLPQRHCAFAMRYDAATAFRVFEPAILLSALWIFMFVFQNIGAVYVCPRSEVVDEDEDEEEPDLPPPPPPSDGPPGLRRVSTMRKSIISESFNRTSSMIESDRHVLYAVDCALESQRSKGIQYGTSLKAWAHINFSLYCRCSVWMYILVFPTMLQAAVGHFLHTTIGSQTVLVNDMGVSVMDDMYTSTLPIAIIGLLFSMTMPLQALVLLIWGRQQEDERKFRYTGFLYDSFRIELWWWEVWRITRKLAFVLIGFFVPAQERTLVGMIALMISIAAEIHFLPFVVQQFNFLCIAGLMTLIVSLFIGATYFGSDKHSEEVENGAKWTLFTIVVLMGVLYVVIGARSCYEKIVSLISGAVTNTDKQHSEDEPARKLSDAMRVRANSSKPASWLASLPSMSEVPDSGNSEEAEDCNNEDGVEMTVTSSRATEMNC